MNFSRILEDRIKTHELEEFRLKKQINSAGITEQARLQGRNALALTEAARFEVEIIKNLFIRHHEEANR